MCTVTFLPLAGGYILTSNRDESILREAALPPQRTVIGGRTVCFPKDPLAGGTWFAAGAGPGALTACLLNGAFDKHAHRPPYRKSRGLVVLDLYGYGDIRRFSTGYDFSGIEPFTLLALDDESGTLSELRWDGTAHALSTLDPAKPRIWSSVTLYDEAMREEKRALFEAWLEEHPRFEPEAIFRLHENGVTPGRNAFRINRDDTLLTVSITSVYRKGSDHYLKYKDLRSAVSTSLSLAS